MSLRQEILRLAATNPEMRPGLLRALMASAAKWPIDPRTAIVYFAVRCEDYNIEEDADDGDETAVALLADDSGRMLAKMETDAVKSLQRLFKTNVMDEGHDSSGNLVCKISVDTVDDVKKIDKVLNQNHIGGDDEIDTGVAYFVANDFRFHPQGVNKPFFGEDGSAEGSLEDWIRAFGKKR